MSSKRNQRRKECEGKMRHASEAAAIQQIASLARKGKAQGDLRPYRCPFCSSWHVGHRIETGKRTFL